MWLFVLPAYIGIRLRKRVCTKDVEPWQNWHSSRVSFFMNMALAPELSFFIKWLRLQSLFLHIIFFIFLHSQCRYTRQCSNWCWDWQIPEIQRPLWQLLLSTSCNWNHWCVWQVQCPFLSCLANTLIDISSDAREQQWLYQHLSLAMVRGNTAIIMACVQVWSDFSHLQCINLCSCPLLAFLQWIAIAFWMSAFSVSFIVFSKFFFMLSVKPLCSIVFLPFSAILTNLILFVFHVSNTTGLLFTVKPLCNLSLPLSVQPHLGVLCAWWNTHNGGTP